MPSAERLRRLAALLAFPDTDALRIVQEAAALEPWLGEHLSELGAFALEQWQGEYTRLFISDYPRTRCPPFESAYRQGSMGGAAAVDLEQLYGRAGLRSTDMPADYLGTILECAAYLSEGDADPDQSIRSRLWNEHLTPWVPGFARDLIAHSRLGLYRGLGREFGAMFRRNDNA